MAITKPESVPSCPVVVMRAESRLVVIVLMELTNAVIPAADTV